MKKRIKIALVAATIVALPLMGAEMQQSKSEEKSLLVDFIEYCKTCENLRQVDPNKDYTQATLHELKNAARFTRNRRTLPTAQIISSKQR